MVQGSLLKAPVTTGPNNLPGRLTGDLIEPLALQKREGTVKKYGCFPFV